MDTATKDIIQIVLTVLAVIVIPMTVAVVKGIIDINNLKTKCIEHDSKDKDLEAFIGRVKKDGEDMHHVMIEEINTVRGQQNSVGERLAKIETLLELIAKGLNVGVQGGKV